MTGPPSYGVFDAGAGPRLGVALGDEVVDVGALATAHGSGLADVLDAPSLDPLLATGPDVWRRAHDDVATWLREPDLPRHPLADVRMRLPFTVADFVDFYSSEHHAANVGRILRPGSEPLGANWRHLPVGYHGRAGSVVVSGTPVRRPRGQRLPDDGPPDGPPEFGPTRRLDIEAEVGFVVGGSSGIGRPITVGEASEHIFGVVLVNDWSARDLQAWEYVPLGPFLGKSFATSISAWVLPWDALAHAWVAPPPRDVPLLEHLVDPGDAGLDLTLEIRLNGHPVSRPPFRTTYWTPAQQLAHLTSNGAPTRPGDLFASGTVSGPEPGEYGSLLEMTWGGRDPLVLPDGRRRTFLEDGDEVVITAWAPGPVELGPVAGVIEPA